MNVNYKRLARAGIFFIISEISLSGCGCFDGNTSTDDGPVAEGISAALGEPLPGASSDELEMFRRGKEVFLRRFDRADGLGPAFNATFCGACHEKPAVGGSSGLYRNFFLSGHMEGDRFVLGTSAGDAKGVIRMYNYGPDDEFRPVIPEESTIFAQRNPIPLFGMGLITEISGNEFWLREDPDDEDGDGISGRVNYDGSRIGRFGRKAQTATIESFSRSPLFNHMGITTDPLTAEQKSGLPGLTSSRSGSAALSAKGPAEQVGVPDSPTTDDDGIADPEMSADDLADVIGFVMLLAAPQLEDLTTTTNSGRLEFREAGCDKCHVPRVDSPRGPLPLYSDLLIHDMGEGLADGTVQGQATGSEFRTQPLWGIAAVGPYLHDGRAETLKEAILAHGGEAQTSRDAFAAFDEAEQEDVIEFLKSLGGRSQISTGLLQPDAPIPAVGEAGGPLRALSAEEEERFRRGREVFDRDFGFSSGAGAMTGPDGRPRFNGDSCRACHFDPVIGGAGPRDVNVMRHGSVDDGGLFTSPSSTPNTILHKEIGIGFDAPEAEDGINVFEHRQTPTALGAALIDAVAEETILANQDPNDDDGDGISGRAHVLGDGRVGRFGWKAQVPSIGEFVRDAMAAEIGLTLPAQEGLSFGLTEDDDGVPDPELTRQEAEDVAFFLSLLGPPPRQTVGDADEGEVEMGEEIFTTVGCAKCHIPSFDSPLGEVRLFSDLLLHEILPAGQAGIEDGDASQREFRTPPLWGLSQTAPYFHSGEADTIEEAIVLHDGEAQSVIDVYNVLSSADWEALLTFLNTL